MKIYFDVDTHVVTIQWTFINKQYGEHFITFVYVK